jgi:type II secretory pathway pseudopilin PulG
MKNKNLQSGYTMVEAIGFLGILAMLAVAIISTINSMMDKYKLSRIGNQISELQKAIDYRFSSAENFNDLTVENV